MTRLARWWALVVEVVEFRHAPAVHRLPTTPPVRPPGGPVRPCEPNSASQGSTHPTSPREDNR